MRRSRVLYEAARRVACGEIGDKLVGVRVEAQGWVQSSRRYGPLLFMNLRDAKGSVQLKCDESSPALGIAQDLHEETVVRVCGTILPRPEEMVNDRMKTGVVEMHVDEIEVLNRPSQPAPIPVERRLRPRAAAIAVTSDPNNNNNKKNSKNSKSGKKESGVASQQVRLRARHLDLRGAEMQRNLRVRSALLHAARSALIEAPLDFVEVETPMLFKSTPEGAREFLVPTRNGEPGSCYALPQSPQQYKQLLMAGGVERYFQVARCFRDEDGRADRQPEFTQLDLEMSFVTSKDIHRVIETVLGRAAASALRQAKEFARNIEETPPLGASPSENEAWEETYIPAPLRALNNVSWPLQSMTFDEVMLRFGSDKPDTRFGMEMVSAQGFSRFNRGVHARAFRVPASVASNWQPSRKIWEALAAQCLADAPANAPSCLALIRTSSKSAASAEWESMRLNASPNEKVLPMLAKLSDDEKSELLATIGAQPGEAIVLGVCQGDGLAPRLGRDALCEVMGRMRLAVGDATGERLRASQQSPLDVFWVREFPMFELAEDGGLRSMHHPFTMPKPEHIDLVRSYSCYSADDGPSQDEMLSVYAQAYDLVCNGAELGGGSVRVHDAALQRHIFEHVLGIPKDRIEPYFGHLLAALGSGCPPHAGIALGVDRLMSVLLDTPSIADVIAFPKSAAGQELLTGSPSRVPDATLSEYRLQVKMA